jgi:BirA family biotin operon repressor/biotin-[acetyl-CoA-carboxylase] ligase
VFREIESTNTFLLNAARPAAGDMRVAIAHAQTHGRGRHGKDWYSPAGAGLWMSIAYTFMTPPKTLPALTLAIGVTLAKELRELGVVDIALKWPNDLLVGSRKLGGILLESRANGMTAIVGIGINLALPKNANCHIKTGNMPVDLRELIPTIPAIELLAAKLIEHLGTTLRLFDQNGFASFATAWSEFDALVGSRVSVQSSGVEQTGIACGIAADGALLIDSNAGMLRVVSGSVNLIDCEEAVA